MGFKKEALADLGWVLTHRRKGEGDAKAEFGQFSDKNE